MWEGGQAALSAVSVPAVRSSAPLSCSGAGSERRES